MGGFDMFYEHKVPLHLRVGELDEVQGNLINPRERQTPTLAQQRICCTGSTIGTDLQLHLFRQLTGSGGTAARSSALPQVLRGAVGDVVR